MRPLEILLLAFLLLGNLLLLLPFGRDPQRGATALRVLAAAALLVFLLQIAFEGAHWQLLPAYFALLPLGLYIRGCRPSIVAASAGCGLLLCAMTAVFSYMLPMFHLPEPTGPYAVGTQVLYVPRQPEPGDDPAILVNGRREVVVQLWYPARYSSSRSATYRTWAETTRLSSYQSVLRTNSQLNAAIGSARTPFHVLIFNPAWSGRRTQNTALCEELASQGYVVAALDHPGNSEPVKLSNGRVSRATSELGGNTEQLRDMVTAEVWRDTRDSVAVLDYLQSLDPDPNSPWYGKLDVTHAGALGHSLGGGVALNLYLTDPRILAALNLDGWSFGKVSTSASTSAAGAKPPQSLMFLYEVIYPLSDPLKLAAGDPETVLDQFDFKNTSRVLEEYGGYRIRVPGTSHWDFTDKNLYSPLRRFSDNGSIRPLRAQAIVRTAAVDFFDLTLKGEEVSLVPDLKERFPELRVESIAGQDTPAADSGGVRLTQASEP